jgi:hypothetical protein
LAGGTLNQFGAVLCPRQQDARGHVLATGDHGDQAQGDQEPEA